MSNVNRVWAGFALAVALSCFAGGWLTWTIVQLDRQDAIAQQESELEEAKRLALWRIDAALMPIVSTELSRPPSHYQSLALVPLACKAVDGSLQPSEAYTPSPLADFRSPGIHLHFEWHANGEISSPELANATVLSWQQSPAAPQADFSQQFASLQAILGHQTWSRWGVTPQPATPPQLANSPVSPPLRSAPTNSPEAVVQAPQVTEMLQQAIPETSFPSQQASIASQEPGPLIEGVQHQVDTRAETSSTQLADPGPQQAGNAGAVPSPPSPAPTRSIAQIPVPQGDDEEVQRLSAQKAYGRARNSTQQQNLRNELEGQQRSKIVAQTNQLYGNFNRNNGFASPDPDANQLSPGNSLNDIASNFQWQWLDNELFLLRSVQRGTEIVVQGCWFDWRQLQDLCASEISDLLPNSELQPALDWSSDPDHSGQLFLAVGPFKLHPGTFPDAVGRLASTNQWALIIAWIGLIASVISFAWLLFGTMALSQRRADFVSAVTHELRTPLTTFRLYTQLLQRGVADAPERRAEYLTTMETEADRLGHLVENVLSYARLERGRTPGRRDRFEVSELLSKSIERYELRVALCGGLFEWKIEDSAKAALVETDPVAFGQIMFNLVDNACKYGVGEQLHVQLRVSSTGKQLEFEVLDRGPGVPVATRHKLFRQFHKSAHQAAESAPGVGLGLALSRRLARNLGGDLVHDKAYQHGAKFRFTLPRVG